FVHYGILHLLLNMWALWMLGRNLEAALGPVRFAALYMLSGLGGSIAGYLFSPDSISAGASGAIFGLFPALFVILKKLRPATSRAVAHRVINPLPTVRIPNISTAGLLGGFVVGAIVAAGLAYAPRQARTAVQTATIV